MAFVKGVSGNKSGRPRQSEEEKIQREEFQRLLCTSTVPALKSIIEIANSKCNKDRFNACRYLLDKAYGNQAVFLSDDIEMQESTVIVVRAKHSNDDEDDEDWEQEWKEAPDDEEE